MFALFVTVVKNLVNWQSETQIIPLIYSSCSNNTATADNNNDTTTTFNTTGDNSPFTLYIYYISLNNNNVDVLSVVLLMLHLQSKCLEGDHSHMTPAVRRSYAKLLHPVGNICPTAQSKLKAWTCLVCT